MNRREGVGRATEEGRLKGPVRRDLDALDEARWGPPPYGFYFPSSRLNGNSGPLGSMSIMSGNPGNRGVIDCHKYAWNQGDDLFFAAGKGVKSGEASSLS
jgi:hypothetical protein